MPPIGSQPPRESERELLEWKKADGQLIRKAMTRIDMSKLNMGALLEKYWGKGILERWREDGVTEQEQQQFLAWLWLDWRKAAGSKTFAEQMAVDESLSELQRQILASLNSAHMSVYQVVKLEPGYGLEMENILEGGWVFVHDQALSRSARKWVMFFCRTYPAGPYHFQTGLGSAYPPAYKEFIREHLAEELAAYRRKAPAAGWGELLANKAEILGRLSVRLNDLMEVPPAVFNTDGEPLVLCRGTFTVKEPEVFLSALTKSDFEETGYNTEEGTEFVWLSDGKDDTVTLGRILLKDNRLVLECNSRGRFAQGIELLQKLGALDLVNKEEKAVDEVFEELHAAHGIGEARMEDSEKLPPGAEGYLKEYLERHYDAWIDQQLPALDGKTPRQASKTVSGRQQLTGLIREMEYADSQQRGAGHLPYDWNKLRRRLGLASE